MPQTAIEIALRKAVEDKKRKLAKTYFTGCNYPVKEVILMGSSVPLGIAPIKVNGVDKLAVIKRKGIIKVLENRKALKESYPGKEIISL